MKHPEIGSCAGNSTQELMRGKGIEAFVTAAWSSLWVYSIASNSWVCVRAKVTFMKTVKNAITSDAGVMHLQKTNRSRRWGVGDET